MFDVRLGFAVTIYMAMGVGFFIGWQRLSKADEYVSLATEMVSFWIAIVGAVLWPVVVPLAYLEILYRHNGD